VLHSLHIQNYALIEKLDIDFESGFSVITGETGAGKSIILGAIGLLLGQRADIKAIRQGVARCVIEAQFDISAYQIQAFFEKNELEYDHKCIIRRELQSSGKSRAFINDIPASLQQMKDLGEQLIDIHSQHQNLLLNKEDFQLNVLDILAHNNKERDSYRKTYTEWKQLDKKLTDLITQASQIRVDEEYIRFQLEQLSEARLTAGEQASLEKEAELLTHAEDIKVNLYHVKQALTSDDNGILLQLKESFTVLSNLQKVYSSVKELAERMESCYIELKDQSQEIDNQYEKIEFNPIRLEEVNERLNLIYSLQQKHRVQTEEELIALAEAYQKKLSTITSFDEHIIELTKQRDAKYDELKQQAETLTQKRISIARKVEQEMSAHLIPLGMPNIRFQVETQLKEPCITGQDAINFLFSTNKNGTLQPVSSVASGGEIARVMLSVKAMIAGTVKFPTIIFDEIDTGVSGDIANRMADIMQKMGMENRQVISITHLPQIAARGQVHYKVYKQDNELETNSHIRRLTETERVEEIAQMLSGSQLTEAALNNAKELLKQSTAK
jgi:DNA repair protein RecN (Recombination protein N)